MNLPNETQLSLVEQLTTLNEQLDQFINGGADEIVATRSGPIKTLAGIIKDLSRFRYVQKIVDHRLVSDMNADDLEVGILVRVWGDLDDLNGLYKKLDDTTFAKVSYADLVDLLPPA